MTDQPLVSADEMASVLGSDENQEAAPVASEKGATVAYSLRRPLAISPEDEERARARVATISESLIASIRRQLDATLECEEQGFQQQQTSAAVGSLEEPAWILAFEAEGGGGLAFVMDPACSMSLIELALGGAGTSSAGGRAPTNLETRVMNNLGRALLEPFSAKAGVRLNRPIFATGSVPTEVATAGEMVAASILKLKFGDAERGALLLATSSLFRDANSAGDDAPVAAGPLNDRLSKVLVDIRPVLRAGKVSLKDLTELQPGSVLRFESDEQRELDLRVQGLGLMRGRISREEGSVQFGVTWRRPGSCQEPVATAAEPATEEPS